MGKELSTSEWAERIKLGEKARDTERDIKNWETYIEEYQGNYKRARIPADIPIANLVYGYVHTAIPKIYFRDPYTCVNPKKGTTQQQAQLLEADINYTKSITNEKYEVEKALIDTYLVGHGWIKQGYSGAFESSKPPTEKIDGEPNIQVSEFVKDEEIFTSYVPWDEMVFDPMAKDPPYDCRWVAQKIIKPLDAVKDSPLYSNTGTLEPNVSMKELNKALSGKGEMGKTDIHTPLLSFWEIWDLDSGKIKAMVEGKERWLRSDAWPYSKMPGFPYSMLKFNRVNGKPYPLSDIFLIHPQILQRILLSNRIIQHTKRWARQMAIEQGAAEIKEIEKWEQGIDGALIQIKKGYQPPKPIEYAAIAPENFRLDEMLGELINEVIGSNELEKGNHADTQTKTKFELEAQLQGTAPRTQKRQDMLEDFIEELDKKKICLIQQFADTDRFVGVKEKSAVDVAARFGGEMASTFDGSGISYNKDKVSGEYDVEVKAGSTIPMNKSNRLKVIEHVLPMLPDGPVKEAAIREILRELDLKEIEKAYDEQAALQKQQPPPAPPMVPQVAPPQAVMPPHANGIAPPMSPMGA